MNNETASVPVPTLDLQDLGIMVNLINIAIKRGTFDATELRTVLSLHEKLENFIKYQAQSQAANKLNHGEP